MTCLVDRRALRHRGLDSWHAPYQAVLGSNPYVIVLESAAGHVAHSIYRLSLLDQALSRGIMHISATGRKKMSVQRPPRSKVPRS